MLLILEQGLSLDRREALEAALTRAGHAFRRIEDRGRESVRVDGDASLVPWLQALSGVERVVTSDEPFPQAARGSGDRRGFAIGNHRIGDGGMTIVAGPCAIEEGPDWSAHVTHLKRCGAQLLRGGAFKPRSSPYDFQGLGIEGLQQFSEIAAAADMPLVTEAVDERSLDVVERHAQMIQIGARNMQNYALLKRAGESRLPVMLKRGLAASIEDWLLAAEYLLDRGNDHVVLCERGIRTFSTHSRFTLDLSVIPRIQALSHLPILVDPSHGTGIRESVAPMAQAAVAARADGVMVEVHPLPQQALCDGEQALTPDDFEQMMTRLHALAALRETAHEPVP